MINIVLVENQAFIRKAIKLLLENEADFSVISEASNFNDGINCLNNFADTDIIIADVDMSGITPIDFIEAVRNTNPNVKVIFLTATQNEKDILKIMNAGAKGFLNKAVNVVELMFAIRHVYDGGQYVCSFLTKVLLDKLKSIPEVTPMEIDHEIEFPAREIEILILMANGYTNYEIAEKLFTSKRTIEGHRQNLLNKTGSRNTAALIKFAIQYGVIKC